MKKNNRKSVSVQTKEFCILAKEHDFIEVTEWANGDGFDVCTEDELFYLTWGQFKALKKIVKELKK